MTLIAVGVDLCDTRRIERTIQRFGLRFLERVFTLKEREYADACSADWGRVGRYAKRWAAKEACAKALGTGFAHGVTHSQIEVEHLLTGAPMLRLTGNAIRRLEEMTPDGCVLQVLLSLTDEMPYAFAQVIIVAHTNQ
ncbi:MAG: holo-ACP synthase [Acetobacter sp.]|nr:holo-ACP synthase [Acetobacter sp.]MBQ5773409.1 holo-ACP synthase [Acetobacter sp.]